MADAGSSTPTRIYLDHGATSWPKPPEVVAAVTESLTRYGGNPGRGSYELALTTARALHGARRDIAQFFGVTDARNLTFQPGCTQAMNLVLHGLIRPGDRVVAGALEHNAVARPLNLLAARGAEVIIAPVDDSGVVDADAVEQLVSEAPTRAVVCQQAGNLSGTIQPVADLADVAHAHGALMLVDGAQAGGHVPIDLERMGIDAWACSGHKGLLGPQGIGVLYLAPDCDPEPLISGGTGAGGSEEPLQPRVRPDLYEAGTANVPGILGLAAGIGWLAQHRPQHAAHERALVERLYEGILAIGGFRVLGPDLGDARVPVIAAVHDTVPVDRMAMRLDRDFGIAARGGLHCAPWAHEVFGTLASGALRFGIGYGNTESDIDETLAALATIVAEHR